VPTPTAGGRRAVALAAVFTGLALSGAARADSAIVLKNEFIDKYKDRATIEVDDFLVVKAHKKPNPAATDGDMHVAGLSKTVGLVTVAELMNAASEPEVVGLIHDLEGKRKPVRLAGVWRVWCEHPKADVSYDQRSPFDPDTVFKNANPDHVFEIHPITRFGDHDGLRTLRPVRGYETVLRQPGRTRRAFDQWGDKAFEIRPGNNGVTTLLTRKADPNYVEFTFRLEDAPKPLAGGDGTAVTADVLDPDDPEEEELAADVRMVFVAGSAPEQEVKRRRKGDTMRVVGIPRVSLARVRERLDKARTDPDALKGSLPYEIVVVGVVTADEVAGGPRATPQGVTTPSTTTLVQGTTFPPPDTTVLTRPSVERLEQVIEKQTQAMNQVRDELARVRASVEVSGTRPPPAADRQDGSRDDLARIRVAVEAWGPRQPAAAERNDVWVIWVSVINTAVLAVTLLVVLWLQSRLFYRLERLRRKPAAAPVATAVQTVPPPGPTAGGPAPPAPG
jgi:hypothetical protein